MSRPTNRIEVGQTWSMSASASSGHTFTFRVTSVSTTLIGCETPDGRKFSTSYRTLARGLRHSKLLKTSDGTAVVHEPEQSARPARPADTIAETRTASSLIRERKPRGMISERASHAARLRSEGMSPKDIAVRMGVKASTVSRWISEVKAAERG